MISNSAADIAKTSLVIVCTFTPCVLLCRFRFGHESHITRALSTIPLLHLELFPLFHPLTPSSTASRRESHCALQPCELCLCVTSGDKRRYPSRLFSDLSFRTTLHLFRHRIRRHRPLNFGLMTPTPASSNNSQSNHNSPDDLFRVIRKRNRIPLSCAPCRHRK
jgi:hypothetical protein